MKVLLEINLHRPYGRSIDPLLEMANIWSCDLVRVGPQRSANTIAMSFRNFRTIWDRNPVVGEIEVPSGTEHFIQAIRVVKILP